MKKSAELQHLFDKNDTRGFFGAARAVYGPSSHGLAPLRSKDGSVLLKSNSKITFRWKEHFPELLNCDPVTDDSVLEQLPHFPPDRGLGSVPTIDEILGALSSMKNHKAAGPDNIPAEALKNGGDLLHLQIQQLISQIWVNERIPPDLRDGTIITIYKKKGDRADCGNYWGITLLSTTGKVLARVLATRLSHLAEGLLPETQCGFRPGRGTTDMIFSARQLQEKCMELRRPLYMGFIDFTKAFDSVKRELLWEILMRFGCPKKFVQILKLLHDDMSVTVAASGNTTEPFRVRSGVKQGCVIAPTLFSIFISAVLHLAQDHLPPGISINYRTDGGIFNLRRLKAQTKACVASIAELQYADDNVICALSEADLQATINAFFHAYARLGLAVNERKTQILYQPAPNSHEAPPNIQISGKNLETVEHFSYLGSHLSASANIDEEIQYRMRCASSSLGRLPAIVFDKRFALPYKAESVPGICSPHSSVWVGVLDNLSPSH